jgi:hypothetical protein
MLTTISAAPHRELVQSMDGYLAAYAGLLSTVREFPGIRELPPFAESRMLTPDMAQCEQKIEKDLTDHFKREGKHYQYREKMVSTMPYQPQGYAGECDMWQKAARNVSQFTAQLRNLLQHKSPQEQEQFLAQFNMAASQHADPQQHLEAVQKGVEQWVTHSNCLQQLENAKACIQSSKEAEKQKIIKEAVMQSINEASQVAENMVIQPQMQAAAEVPTAVTSAVATTAAPKQDQVPTQVTQAVAPQAPAMDHAHTDNCQHCGQTKATEELGLLMKAVMKAARGKEPDSIGAGYIQNVLAPLVMAQENQDLSKYAEMIAASRANFEELSKTPERARDFLAGRVAAYNQAQTRLEDKTDVLPKLSSVSPEVLLQALAMPTHNPQKEADKLLVAHPSQINTEEVKPVLPPKRDIPHTTAVEISKAAPGGPALPN